MHVYRFSVAMNSLISSLSANLLHLIFLTGNITSKVIIAVLMNDFCWEVR